MTSWPVFPGAAAIQAPMSERMWTMGHSISCCFGVRQWASPFSNQAFRNGVQPGPSRDHWARSIRDGSAGLRRRVTGV